jgi:predicted DNA-binding transcriptional regulator YafY
LKGETRLLGEELQSKTSQFQPSLLTPQDDGRLVMELPFTDLRELSMDILRQGRHVEVLGPPELRAQVAQELRETLGQYADSGPDANLS